MERLAYTLGYGPRPLQETIRLIKKSKAKIVIDVRRYAKSKRRPEYTPDNLKRELAKHNIRYIHTPALGGHLPPGSAPEHIAAQFTCYQSPGFRLYAAYLATHPQAQRALETIWYSLPHTPLILCAELHPWRCHRKIIADWLTLHNVKVIHILASNKQTQHKGTRCINTLAKIISPTTPPETKGP